MAAPEHAYTHEVPSHPTHCVECPSAAEFACDDSIPDGNSRCQRSTVDSPSACCSPTCLDRAQGVIASDHGASWSPYRLLHHFLGPCCPGDSNARRLAISHQDQCCLGSRQCCTLDSQNVECHQGIFGCFDASAGGCSFFDCRERLL
jgi:hypothetical protein